MTKKNDLVLPVADFKTCNNVEISQSSSPLQANTIITSTTETNKPCRNACPGCKKFKFL